ncbi:MAG: TRAM domain-containing protein [Methanobacteriota archaeon]|nr:MAG: TRAM domain-containing protein [Euryarchaeota archaeon]
MSRRWLKEKRKDHYYRKAKSEDYRSRASYKLKQLNRRFGLIKKGDAVLDLGAAPGGWMQVAGEAVGDTGIVVGVDLAGIKPFKEENLITLQGDITKEETIERIRAVQETFNAVICDASPDISGAWDIDHFNSVELGRHALRMAGQVLREGGSFLVKVFQGSLLKEFEGEVKREFEFVKVAKPKASRKESSEVYIVAKGLLKTPVRYGDILEVEITEQGRRPGEGIAYVDGYRVIVEDGQVGEKTRVRIKKATRRAAWGVKV